MTRRGHILSATAAGILVAALVACAPQSNPTPAASPSPSPTGFSSDAEAFAAAEATYRAYVDALNKVDLANPDTFRPAQAWLAGAALEQEQRSLSDMHQLGWAVSGQSRVVLFEGQENGEDRLIAFACLDVSQIRLVDSTGESQVRADRPSAYGLGLTFNLKDDSGVIRISEMTAVEDPRCS